MPMHQLQASITVLYQSRTALDPVAIIAIEHTANFTHLRAVNMAANDTLVTSAKRFGSDGFLKISHVIQRLLYLAFEVRRQGPIRQARPCSQAIEITVELERKLVKVVTEMASHFAH